MNSLLHFVRIAIAVGAGFLIGRISVLPLLVSLLASIAIPAIGTVLLRNAEPEKITWRNRTAGWLLPWGYRIGRGKLLAIAVVSGIVWGILLGLGVLLAQPAPAMVREAPAPFLPDMALVLLVLAWIVDGAALFYLLGMLSQNSSLSQPPGSTQLKTAAFVCFLLAASIGCHVTGRSGAALWIAGLPPLVLGILLGAWFAVLLSLGKNARWN